MIGVTFWSGFEKAASGLLDAARAGMKAGKNAKNVAQKATPELGQYWKATVTEKIPVWKQKMIAAGKKPAGSKADQLHLDSHQAAANEELLKRRKSLAQGGTPLSAWKKALGEE